MDAVPVTLGQEFGGYAAQVRLGARRVRNALPQVAQIPLGGTATGTGLNTHQEFATRVRAHLIEASGLEIRGPEDPFEAQGNRDALVELSGALKVVAVSLTKIANDLALLGSGPRAGIGEIFLPELQKGSSIMPGKVNPVIPEVVLQVSAQVIGNDTAITIGGMQGQFELNVRVPLIARNLLESIRLLANTAKIFAEKCVDGITRQRGGLPPLGRVDARRGDGAEPAHRLRQGRRDRQGGGELRPDAPRGRLREGRRRGDVQQGDGPAQDGAGEPVASRSAVRRPAVRRVPARVRTPLTRSTREFRRTGADRQAPERRERPRSGRTVRTDHQPRSPARPAHAYVATVSAPSPMTPLATSIE